MEGRDVGRVGRRGVNGAVAAAQRGGSVVGGGGGGGAGDKELGEALGG